MGEQQKQPSLATVAAMLVAPKSPGQPQHITIPTKAEKTGMYLAKGEGREDGAAELLLHSLEKTFFHSGTLHEAARNTGAAWMLLRWMS